MKDILELYSANGKLIHRSNIKEYGRTENDQMYILLESGGTYKIWPNSITTKHMRHNAIYKIYAKRYIKLEK